MSAKRPNILFITVDQMRYPCLRYRRGGMLDPIKRILSFEPLQEGDEAYTGYFPGFMRLRQNAVAMRQHMIATAACVPSRATIYTGQYGTKTRVLETDSLFKYGSDPNFPWLNPRGIPTIGDWFRSAGYTTHYFGKWDLSYVDEPGPQHGDLDPRGFSDWRLSAPDAQGGQLNQLGVYRDPGYVDQVNGFLRRKAMNYESTPQQPAPWFAVASIVNPHDIASAYPMSWWIPEGMKVRRKNANGEEVEIPVAGVQTATADTPVTRPIPSPGDLSNPLPGGRTRVPLNPRAYPQRTFDLPETWDEDLSTKPSCQFDYSYKMGLALKSRRPPVQREDFGLPFQTQENASDWYQAFGDFYSYCHTLADTQINHILQVLDETGLAEDTIVVFLSDHGEYGGAHGGMVEKWHSAYEEIIHVPFVVSSGQVNSGEQMRYVDQLTSHIDILPTLLGLAGYDVQAQDSLGGSIEGHTYLPLPGADLSGVIQNAQQAVVTADGKEREGVLFITDDTITEYLWGEEASSGYHVFQAEVEHQRKLGVPLHPGAVVQPCHIRAARTAEWKLARYFDPRNIVSDQWELYYLPEDHSESVNLVHWDASGAPVLCPERIPSDWQLTAEQLEAALPRMRQLLISLEEQYLGGPRPIVEPYTLEAVV